MVRPRAMGNVAKAPVTPQDMMFGHVDELVTLILRSFVRRRLAAQRRQAGGPDVTGEIGGGAGRPGPAQTPV